MNKTEIFSSTILKSVRSLNKTKKFFSLHSPVIDQYDCDEVAKCLRSSFVSTYSPETIKFEQQICKYTNSKFAVATINATSALQIALKAMGVNHNDEVLLSDLNFIAAANAILYNNAIPHFIDVTLDDLFVDIQKLEFYLKKHTKIKDGHLINTKTERRIKAIIVTYVFGKGGKIDELLKVAKQYNLKVIEDASEALGSVYKNKHLGTFGDIGVISFNGNKIITTGGGGVLLTRSKKIYNDCLKYCTINKKSLLGI